MFIRNEYKRMLLKNIRPISSWKNRWKFIFEITRSHCRNPTQTNRVFVALRRFRRWKKFPPFDFFQFPFNFPQLLLFLSLKWIAARWKQPAEDSEKKRDPYRRRERQTKYSLDLFLEQLGSNWISVACFCTDVVVVVWSIKRTNAPAANSKNGNFAIKQRKNLYNYKANRISQKKMNLQANVTKHIFLTLELHEKKSTSVEERQREKEKRSGASKLYNFIFNHGKNFIIIFGAEHKLARSIQNQKHTHSLNRCIGRVEDSDSECWDSSEWWRKSWLSSAVREIKSLDRTKSRKNCL